MVRESCPTPGVGACVDWCGTHCGPRCCASDAWLQQQAARSLAIHTAVELVANSSAAAAVARRRVMIWQGEKNHSPDRKLSVMYWPVVGTLLEGFRHAAADVEVLLGVGFTLAYHAAIGKLSNGDSLIWVGTNGKLSQPWRKLRQRGVRTVYYNTEPMHDAPCDRYSDTVDELWDFSYFNLEHCARATSKRPGTLRFIPPGYLRDRSSDFGSSSSSSGGGGDGNGNGNGNGNGGSGGSDSGGIRGSAGSSSGVSGHNDPRLALVFFGLLDRLHGQRRACYMRLKQHLGPRLVQRYDVWNASAFDHLMAHAEIFLNLHKFCNTRQPVTFRCAVLLNQRKLLLSEHAHCLDEREYAGMMTFVGVDELAAAYEGLVASDWRRLQRQAHERFAQRFAPKALFTRAAVYRDWELGPLQARVAVEVGEAVDYARLGGRNYTVCPVGVPTSR